MYAPACSFVCLLLVVYFCDTWEPAGSGALDMALMGDGAAGAGGLDDSVVEDDGCSVGSSTLRGGSYQGEEPGEVLVDISGLQPDTK